jgi:hypothetical protein
MIITDPPSGFFSPSRILILDPGSKKPRILNFESRRLVWIREQISERDQPKVVDSPDNFFFQQREHLALSNIKKKTFSFHICGLWVIFGSIHPDPRVLF